MQDAGRRGRLPARLGRVRGGRRRARDRGGRGASRADLSRRASARSRAGAAHRRSDRHRAAHRAAGDQPRHRAQPQLRQLAAARARARLPLLDRPAAARGGKALRRAQRLRLGPRRVRRRRARAAHPPRRRALLRHRGAAHPAEPGGDAGRAAQPGRALALRDPRAVAERLDRHRPRLALPLRQPHLGRALGASGRGAPRQQRLGDVPALPRHPDGRGGDPGDGDPRGGDARAANRQGPLD